MKSSYSYYDIEAPEEASAIQSKNSIKKNEPYSAEFEEQTIIQKQNVIQSEIVHFIKSKTALASESYEQLLANDHYNLGKKARHDEQRKSTKTQVISLEDKAKYMDMRFSGGAQNQPEVKYLIEKEVPETLEEYARRKRDERRAKKELRLQTKLEREGKLKTPEVKTVDLRKGRENLLASEAAIRNGSRKFSRDSSVDKRKKGHEISEEIIERAQDKQNNSESMEIISRENKNSRLRVNIISPPSSSESESENFLKFHHESPKKNISTVKKLGSAKSKTSWKRKNFINEEQSTFQSAQGKLTFTLDPEPLLWKPVQDAMEEENNQSGNKSKAKSSNTKKLNVAISVTKEQVSEREKNAYRVLGHDRIFYSHDTNMVTKLNDYLIKQRDSLEDEAISDEMKYDGTDEIEEHYKYESRYFIENPTKVCRRCHRSGHFEKMCPEEVIIRCLFCCKPHHTSFCASFICFRCNGQGHQAKDCKNIGANICIKCNKKGHKKHECGVMISLIHSLEGSIEEKKTHRSLIKCFKCEQFGHANCNKKGLNSGSQRKIDDLYSDRDWKQIGKELEEELNGEYSENEVKSESDEYDYSTLLKSSEDTQDSGEDFEIDFYSSNRKSWKKGGSKQKDRSNHRGSNRRYSRSDRLHHSSKKITKIRLNDKASHGRRANKKKRYY